MKKIFNILNIHADSNQKWILMSALVSGLLGTYISPMISKEIIGALPAEWLAFQALFSSATAMLLGMIWKGNFRSSVLKRFILFCMSESLIGFLTGMYLCFVEYNVWVLAITTLIYGNLITSLVGKCIMVYKTMLWPEKQRETYDNNRDIVGGITCILGFGVALFAMPGLKTALFLWGLCCIIDDIGWMIVYLRNKKLREEQP